VSKNRNLGLISLLRLRRPSPLDIAQAGINADNADSVG